MRYLFLFVFFWQCILRSSFGASVTYLLENLPLVFSFLLTFLYFSVSLSVFIFSLCLDLLCLSLSHTHSHTLHRVNRSPPTSLLHSQPLHAQRIHWLPRSVETRTSFLTWESYLTHSQASGTWNLGAWTARVSGCEDSKVAPSALLFRDFPKQETDSRIHTSFAAFWDDLQLHKRGEDGGQFMCVLCHWFSGEYWTPNEQVS